MLPKTNSSSGGSESATHRKGGVGGMKKSPSSGGGVGGASRLAVPSGSDGAYAVAGGGSSSHRLASSRSQSSSPPPHLLASAMTPNQYLSRLFDVHQMDVQSALDQMRTLLTLHPQRVYKTAYYRKQTKNHWARDDPAFAALQVAFLCIASLAYCVAFRSRSIVISSVYFALQSVLINFLLAGVLIASTCRAVANSHLAVHPSGAHVRQRVEWLYAFDIHCNAFFPLFVLIYGVQFFLLPLVLGKSLASLLISNTLFGCAFGWYFYVTHLGYRALPFLSNTEVFLFPIAGVALLYVLNLVGYPFGFGWNASRIMAYVYFDE